MKKPRYNQKVNLTIKNLGINGEGVAHWHGYTMFVDGALPGEVIEARVCEVSRRFGRGRVSKIVSASPMRVEPACPYFNRCGGCQIMHMGYQDQLKLKHARVVESFKTKAGIENLPVNHCHPSPKEFGYRNKIQFPIVGGADGIKLGMYARNSHDLIEIDRCLVNCRLGEEIYTNVCSILKESGISAYNFENKEGILRFLLIKSAISTNQALVTLITTPCDKDILKDVAKKIMESHPSIQGVIQNVNSEHDNVVLGEEYYLLEGVSYIYEKILGLTFKVSPASFFQVNPLQAENVYQGALERAELTGDEYVLDAFCGVGTLTLLVAQRCRHVFGVESVPEAIEDAKENARLNKLTNVDFVCAQAENWINGAEKIDVAFLNPPRKGCEESFIVALGKLAPKKIIYVSCDPNSLARDSSKLIELGYSLKSIQPFDMFPQTSHVESVAVFIL